jgi:hypothetical protein
MRLQPKGPDPTPEGPERLPQRWVLILIAALLGAVTVGGLAGSVLAGVATALGIVGLLDKIMR